MLGLARVRFFSAGRVALVSPRARRPIKAAIEVTESAAARLRELLSARPDAAGIRVGVKTRAWLARARSCAPRNAHAAPSRTHARAGGCNGVSYTMTYADTAQKFDEEVVDKGVRVFIEPSALLKITGTVMDWKEDEVSAEFVFTNPLAKGVCGCGESFNT